MRYYGCDADTINDQFSSLKTIKAYVQRITHRLVLIGHEELTL